MLLSPAQMPIQGINGSARRKQTVPNAPQGGTCLRGACSQEAWEEPGVACRRPVKGLSTRSGWTEENWSHSECGVGLTSLPLPHPYTEAKRHRLFRIVELPRSRRTENAPRAVRHCDDGRS